MSPTSACRCRSPIRSAPLWSRPCPSRSWWWPATFTPNEVYGRLPHATLTLTKLDTQGLRLWIATQSTREKRYAIFTMPEFGQMPALLDKPEVTFAARFDRVIYRGMRTDHFSGSSTQPPAVVDLTTHEILAAR